MDQSVEKQEKLSTDAVRVQSAKSKFFIAAKFPRPKPVKETKDGKDISDMSCFVLSITAGLEREIALEESKKAVDAASVPWPNVSDYYDLNETLGAGSYGVVYLATCLPRKEKCAVKLIQLQQWGSISDTIMKNVQALALFNHMNVVSYYSTFVDKQQLWLVLRYMEHGSLRSVIRRKMKHSNCSTGVFSEPVIATIMMGILSGLDYLHSGGYIHRDIKADNILIGADGSVKIADFIIPHSLSRSTNFVGSPRWLAPEMIANSEHKYTPKADVWSLGITAIETATGSPPYHKLPTMKVLMMTLMNEPANLETGAEYREQYERYGRTFRSFISDCLRKDPAERPLSTELLFHPFFKKAKDQKFLEQEFASIPKTRDLIVRKKKKQEYPNLPDQQRKPWILDWSDEGGIGKKEELQSPLRPSIPAVPQDSLKPHSSIRGSRSGSRSILSGAYHQITLKISQHKRELFDIGFKFYPSLDTPALIALDLVRDGLIDPKDRQAVANNLQKLMDYPNQQSIVFPLNSDIMTTETPCEWKLIGYAMLILEHSFGSMKMNEDDDKKRSSAM